MEQNDAYRPIACDFHDKLEALATLRRRVRVLLKDADGAGSASSVEGLIADIYTREDKREFLRLDGGMEIRLDRIVDVAPAGET